MEIISGIVLILLTLVGYSSGKTLAGRGLKVIPTLWDVVVVFLLWAFALVSRAELGKWMAILVWLVLAAVIGAVDVWMSRHTYAKREVKPQLSTDEKGLRRVWHVWKAFAAEMGDFQGRMLLIWFYFIVVTPFGLLVRLFSDPLHIRAHAKSSYWSRRSPDGTTLEDLKRQF